MKPLPYTPRVAAVGVATVLAIAMAHRAGAQSLSLTGTWDGSQTCRGVTFSAVKLPRAELRDEMKITQSQTVPDDLNIQIGTNYYNGRVTLEPAGGTLQKGQAILVHCASSPALSDYSEMVFLKILLKQSGGVSTLRGVSVFRDPSANTKGTMAVGTCKWKYTRTTKTQDPNVAALPGCQ
jgi:hypothetical protein